MNQNANQTKITVTSVPGNPVLIFEGAPGKRDIAKEVARQFGFQMQGKFPVAHSFCGVIDPAPVEEERPADLDLWRQGGHSTSRRWACAG